MIVGGGEGNAAQSSYLPLNRGGRFSANTRGPSFASSDAKTRAPIAFSSTKSVDCWSARTAISFAVRTASGPFLQNAPERGHDHRQPRKVGDRAANLDADRERQHDAHHLEPRDRRRRKDDMMLFSGGTAENPRNLLFACPQVQNSPMRGTTRLACSSAPISNSRLR